MAPPDDGLRGRDFSGTDFSGATLTGRRFGGSNLSGTNFSGATLENADFSGANLSNADLSGAALENADFTDADLTGADLTGANLRDARLVGADLSDATFTGVNLTDATIADRDGPVDEEDAYLVSTVTSIVTGATLALAFGLLALGWSGFWIVFVIGFAAVLPVATTLASWYEQREVDAAPEPDRDAHPESGSRPETLETLRERYAAGELSDAAFERRVERLLEPDPAPDDGAARAEPAPRADEPERDDPERELDPS